MYVCMYVLCTYMYANKTLMCCVYVHVCMYICIFVCMFVCMYVFVYVCVFVCMCFLYVCMY